MDTRSINNFMKGIKFALVENKCDLYGIESVSIEEGNNLAEKNGDIFQKTLAKSGVAREFISKFRQVIYRTGF